MVEPIDLAQVNWARAQFALTAMYHWTFVPLTLGLSFLVAFFESIYVRTGNEQWKRLTKFWMALFAINFAIGVATGIILEFEFGTNWSNYSWMVGDIFGAPLAVEGIFAFFLEATFFAVMFFGWNRVSKGFHLFSTWMVAVGSNLSALWILVANGWMQSPVGMKFNPDTARFEMDNFWDILFSPVAISKFTHATSSGFLLASLFVVGVSCWYLLQQRHQRMATRSIVVASVFGLLSATYVGLTGDEAAYSVAHRQPMKLAAMEGLFKGQTDAPLVALGFINSEKQPGDTQQPFAMEIKIPGLLSVLANRSPGSFVPGIDDLVYGNEQYRITGAAKRIEQGRQAVNLLAVYKQARQAGDAVLAEATLKDLAEVADNIGYGYLRTPAEAMPPFGITYYAFHLMVIGGTIFPLVFLAFLYCQARQTLQYKSWLQYLGIFCIPLGYLTSQAGWVLAEVGRQPWAIQGLLPVTVANTMLNRGAVQTTFFIFAGLFTLLMIAEISIMLKQINLGPEEN